MKINRTQNATNNIIFGVLLRIYKIILPFIVRTALIYSLGIEYLGLDSLFTSILQVLNLAELGVGSAMTFSMYKPIVEDDSNKICALMRLYKVYYRIIGAVILAVGCCLIPYIPNLIKGDVPADINIYILYILNLSATVLSYWLFAYKSSILNAHQRTDLISKVTLVTDTCKFLMQIAALIIIHNYYYFVIAILLSQLLNNIVVALVSDKIFPNYKACGDLDMSERKNINKRIRDLFTARIGGVVLEYADTIVISAFLGLVQLAIYQNYFYLFSAISGIIMIIFTSVSAGIGNSLIVDSKEKIFNDFKKFLFIISWITGFCCVCFLCLYQPFMEWWVGKENLADFKIVICLVIYFYIYQINRFLNLYKDSAGMWHEDRLRPLFTAIFNLSLNLILVNYIGLYGIVLSTVISLLVLGMPWLIHNLFTVIFEKDKIMVLVKKLIYYATSTTIVCFVTYITCSYFKFTLIADIVIRLLICLIVPNILFVFIYKSNTEFKQSIQLFDNMTKGKIKFLRTFK